jgi:biopolymer transport protein ExbB
MLINNLVAFFQAAGIVAWPLLAFSIASVALIGERLYFWFRVYRRQPQVIRDVLRLYRTQPTIAIKKLKVNADLPMCRIFLEALGLEDPNPEEFRLALESAAQAEIPILKRFNMIFDTIITAAPLLGLLGTVLGLMRSFSSLDIGAIAGAKAVEVSGGIGEALASTAMGLVVAISTLLFASAFRAFYIRQSALIQEYGGQLELLYRHQYQKQKVREGQYATA